MLDRPPTSHARARVERLESEVAAEKSLTAKAVAQAETAEKAAEEAKTEAQESAVRAEQSRLRAEAITTQLAVAQQRVSSVQGQRDSYQERLQTQYNLRWNRIGSVLRRRAHSERRRRSSRTDRTYSAQNRSQVGSCDGCARRPRASVVTPLPRSSAATPRPQASVPTRTVYSRECRQRRHMGDDVTELAARELLAP